MKELILVEKYRPKEFSEVIGLDPEIPKIVNKNLPNILFQSPSPGTGKTSICRIIINKLGVSYLELNASDERKLEDIRDKVKVFAKTKPTKGDFKIVFLDECDYLAPFAQPALRNIMETYSSNCRFILTCNYLNRIIEPIQSRCIIFELSNPKKEEILERLKYICDNEKIEYELEALKLIINKNYPDIRSCINLLQKYNNTKITYDLISKERSFNDEIYELIKNKKFGEIRNLLKQKNPNYTNLISFLYEKFYCDKNLYTGIKKLCILELAECNFKNEFVADKELNFVAFVLKIMEKLR